MDGFVYAVAHNQDLNAQTPSLFAEQVSQLREAENIYCKEVAELARVIPACSHPSATTFLASCGTWKPAIEPCASKYALITIFSASIS
jgi:hypothetical protein